MNLLQHWDRLRDTGVPLLDSCTMYDGVEIEYSPAETMLIMVAPGGTAYIIHLGITKTAKSSFIISDWGLGLPWPDHTFRWLDRSESDTYIVPGTSITYSSKDVLNHRTGELGSLARPMRGLLLGFGHARVPECYSGFPVELRLSVCDTMGRQVSQNIQAFVDRSAERVASRRLSRQEIGLFAGAERQPRRTTFGASSIVSSNGADIECAPADSSVHGGHVTSRVEAHLPRHR